MYILKKKVLFILFAAILLLSFCTYILFHYSNNKSARATIDSFLDKLSSGDTKAAETFLYNPSSKLKIFLQQMTHSSELYIKKPISLKLSGASCGTCKLTAVYKQSQFQIHISIIKMKNKWYIANFPVWDYYPGIYLMKKSKDMEGCTYQFKTSAGIRRLYNKNEYAEIQEGAPYQVIAWDGNLIDISTLQKEPSEKILRVTDTIIEDSNFGETAYDPNITVYDKIGNDVVLSDIKAIIPGLQNATYYTNHNQIVSILLPENKKVQKLRVLIRTDHFTSYEHKSLTLSSKSGLQLAVPLDNFEYSLPKGQLIRFNPTNSKDIEVSIGNRKLGIFDDRILITPTANEKIIVSEIHRYNTPDKAGTPYHGSMEIINMNNKLVLINEVSPEEYLYSVVPSEMPVNFGLEALKVQAIAARSYALSSMTNTGYRYLGAHVDDSTASQVYNNHQETAVSNKAVDETAGLVSVFNNKIIKAVFFSTSCGSTANHNEVWENQENNTFPGTVVPYLVHRKQGINESYHFEDETSFREFIKNSNLESFDKYSPFFRWNITWNINELNACIRENLPKLQKLQTRYILTRDNEGRFIQNKIDPNNIGDLEMLKVIKRGQGGNIITLDLYCRKGVFRIIKELNIRNVLRPIQYLEGNKAIKINCINNSVRENFPLLPSTFVTFEFVKNESQKLTAVTANGGGYGHGCGMSQYGTLGMVKKGYSYQEIIRHYYPGTKLVNYLDIQ